MENWNKNDDHAEENADRPTTRKFGNLGLEAAKAHREFEEARKEALERARQQDQRL